MAVISSKSSAKGFVITFLLERLYPELSFFLRMESIKGWKVVLNTMGFRVSPVKNAVLEEERV